MISWVQVALGVVSLFGAIMGWLAKREALKTAEWKLVAEHTDAVLEQIRKASTARDDVRAGHGLPVDDDPYNRDRG